MRSRKQIWAIAGAGAVLLVCLLLRDKFPGTHSVSAERKRDSVGKHHREASGQRIEKVSKGNSSRSTHDAHRKATGRLLVTVQDRSGQETPSPIVVIYLGISRDEKMERRLSRPGSVSLTGIQEGAGLVMAYSERLKIAPAFKQISIRSESEQAVTLRLHVGLEISGRIETDKELVQHWPKMYVSFNQTLPHQYRTVEKRDPEDFAALFNEKEISTFDLVQVEKKNETRRRRYTSYFALTITTQAPVKKDGSFHLIGLSRGMGELSLIYGGSLLASQQVTPGSAGILLTQDRTYTTSDTNEGPGVTIRMQGLPRTKRKVKSTYVLRLLSMKEKPGSLYSRYFSPSQSIGKLPGGSYYAEVEVFGVDGSRLYGNAPIVIFPGTSQDIQFNMKPSVRVEWVIRSSSTGQPIAAVIARHHLDGGFLRRFPVPIPRDDIALPAQVPQGTFSYRITAPGHKTKVLRFSFAGKSEKVEVTLQKD